MGMRRFDQKFVGALLTTALAFPAMAQRGPIWPGATTSEYPEVKNPRYPQADVGKTSRYVRSLPAAVTIQLPVIDNQPVSDNQKQKKVNLLIKPQGIDRLNRGDCALTGTTNSVIASVEAPASAISYGVTGKAGKSISRFETSIEVPSGVLFQVLSVDGKKGQSRVQLFEDLNPFIKETHFLNSATPNASAYPMTKPTFLAVACGSNVNPTNDESLTATAEGTILLQQEFNLFGRSQIFGFKYNIGALNLRAKNLLISPLDSYEIAGRTHIENSKICVLQVKKDAGIRVVPTNSPIIGTELELTRENAANLPTDSYFYEVLCSH